MDKCPMCGYSDAPAGKILATVMNEYVNVDTKKVLVFNSTEDMLNIVKGDTTQTYLKRDLWEKKVAAEATSAKVATPVSTQQKVTPPAK